MLTVYVRTSDDRLEIGLGELRAQFELRDDIWVPGWMWQGDRRMLRFKNHEWLSLGHVRPKAGDWEVTEDFSERVSVRFWGQDSYFGVPVEWSVIVAAEALWPGFTITTEIIPAQTIELVECFTRFETPNCYDGHEEMLCMIGQNPVTYWRGGQLVSPAPLEPTLWRVAGDQIAQSLTPSRTPICCLRVGPDEDGGECHVTLLGHWDTCCIRNICVVPTRFVDGKRGYEILMGVLDWRCASGTEPNVFFDGGECYRQRVSVAFSSEMPGGTLDRWFFGAFERSLRHFFPKDADVETDRRARAKKSSLADANAWLLKTMCGEGVPGLYSPERGIVTYTEGSCPTAGQFSLAQLAPWLGALGYQAYVTRRDDLQETCKRLVGRVAEAVDRPQPMQWTVGPTFCAILPLLRYLTCFPNDTLHGTIRRAMGRMLEAFPPEAGEIPDVDFGSEAFHAESYLLAGQLAGDERLLRAGQVCLERINAAGGNGGHVRALSGLDVFRNIQRFCRSRFRHARVRERRNFRLRPDGRVCTR
ncbi:hypothetical protein AMJ85_05235 [candidate division BRC1 bacterium SM23_51]|nr:MAG: hypothetical protein AMJ85_05235 [candidate division BRC1 bacterium SM23_51]